MRSPSRDGGAATAAPPVEALRVHAVSRRFGGTQALAGVDLRVVPGTIHALVGVNGAGKSTLAGILAGRIQPSTGHLDVFGRRTRLPTPRAAQAHGIAAIHQELAIVPTLSARDNVFLGRYPSRRWQLDEAAMRARYDRLCERLGVDVPGGTRASRLSVAQQQLVEIMRAVNRDARILLLDEPTAALGPPEKLSLFALMAQLRRAGVTMVFISHDLDDVLRIADRVTVLRNGRVEGDGPVGAWNRPGLARAMVGGPDGSGSVLPPARPTAPVAGAAPRAGRGPRRPERLRVEGLTVTGVLSGVDLTLHRGEILGLAGLVGSGRSTVLRALAGLEHPDGGQLYVDGVPVPWPRSVRRAARLGIGLLPEDRRRQGLLAALSAQENIALADLAGTTRGALIRPARVRAAAAGAARAVGFAAERLDETARHLSGGNQQKLLVARWLLRRPGVLLADEPDRGIDVGTRTEILRTLRREADAGMAVLLVMSRPEDLAAAADRVVVLAGGRSRPVIGPGDRPQTGSGLLLAALGLGTGDG